LPEVNVETVRKGIGGDTAQGWTDGWRGGFSWIVGDLCPRYGRHLHVHGLYQVVETH